MAPSSNYTLMAFLVAFAVVAPNLLHQSAAARDGGAAKAAAAPAPSSEVVLQPSYAYEIPDLPLPRILPCPPVFPKIPFIPCYSPQPPSPPPQPTRPKECRPALAKLMPLCSGYLTNTSSAPITNRPSNECCAGANLFRDGDKSIYSILCLCHLLNGDVNQLLPAPLNLPRAMFLVQACLGINPTEAYNFCNTPGIPELTPPMELPKPPTPAPGIKA